MNGRARPLVVVDPGHGGADPGAVNEAAGYRESDLNLTLAEAFLRVSQGAAYDVVLLRTTDVFLSLEERARLANEADASAVLSFHCNAAESAAASGFEVWTSPGQTAADRLATLIYLELDAALVMPGREDLDDGDPDKEARFYILRKTLAPAVLVEFGFITNESDLADLADEHVQDDMVGAVKRALEGWLRERLA